MPWSGWGFSNCTFLNMRRSSVSGYLGGLKIVRDDAAGGRNRQVLICQLRPQLLIATYIRMSMKTSNYGCNILFELSSIRFSGKHGGLWKCTIIKHSFMCCLWRWAWKWGSIKNDSILGIFCFGNLIICAFHIREVFCNFCLQFDIAFLQCFST